MKNLLFAIILPVMFVLVFSPGVSLAQSSIIPCGFDTDGSGTVSGAEQCTFDNLITLAQNVINFLIFMIAAPIAAVMFAYAGFLMVTNQGNESQVNQAKGIFTNVLIGFVIALAAWLLVNYVLVFFLGDNSKFNLLTQ